MKFKTIAVYALLGLGLIAAFSFLFLCSSEKSTETASVTTIVELEDSCESFKTTTS